MLADGRRCGHSCPLSAVEVGAGATRASGLHLASLECAPSVRSSGGGGGGPFERRATREPTPVRLRARPMSGWWDPGARATSMRAAGAGPGRRRPGDQAGHHQLDQRRPAQVGPHSLLQSRSEINDNTQKSYNNRCNTNSTHSSNMQRGGCPSCGGSGSSTSSSNNRGSIRCKSILASPSVSVLFVMLGFLVIANTNCDHVGSTNVSAPGNSASVASEPNSSSSSSSPSPSPNSSGQADRDLDALEQQHQAAASALAKSRDTKQKFDPLNVLREIYLDHDSKVTMFLPEESTVQKFHPNGRYGRRSVDNFAEPHTELGRLVLDDQVDTSRVSILGPVGNAEGGQLEGAGSLRTVLRGLTRTASLAKMRRNGERAASAVEKRQQQQQLQQQAQQAQQAQRAQQARQRAQHEQHERRMAVARRARVDGRALGDMLLAHGARAAESYELEANKLLSCNYAGISNLYFCDLTGGQVAPSVT